MFGLIRIYVIRIFMVFMLPSTSQGDVVCHRGVWPTNSSSWLRCSNAGLGERSLQWGGYGPWHCHVGSFGDATAKRLGLLELLSTRCCSHCNLGHHLADGSDDQTPKQGSQKCCHDHRWTAFSWDYPQRVGSCNNFWAGPSLFAGRSGSSWDLLRL